MGFFTQKWVLSGCAQVTTFESFVVAYLNRYLLIEVIGPVQNVHNSALAFSEKETTWLLLVYTAVYKFVDNSLRCAQTFSLGIITGDYSYDIWHLSTVIHRFINSAKSYILFRIVTKSVHLKRN